MYCCHSQHFYAYVMAAYWKSYAIFWFNHQPNVERLSFLLFDINALKLQICWCSSFNGCKSLNVGIKSLNIGIIRYCRVYLDLGYLAVLCHYHSKKKLHRKRNQILNLYVFIWIQNSSFIFCGYLWIIVLENVSVY